VPSAGEEGLRFANVLFFHTFSDLYQTNYFNIHRTNLHEICRIGNFGRKLNDLKLFLIPQKMLLWQPILWAKSTSFPHL